MEKKKQGSLDQDDVLYAGVDCPFVREVIARHSNLSIRNITNWQELEQYLGTREEIYHLGLTNAVFKSRLQGEQRFYPALILCESDLPKTKTNQDSSFCGPGVVGYLRKNLINTEGYVIGDDENSRLIDYCARNNIPLLRKSELGLRLDQIILSAVQKRQSAR